MRWDETVTAAIISIAVFLCVFVIQFQSTKRTAIEYGRLPYTTNTYDNGWR